MSKSIGELAAEKLKLQNIKSKIDTLYKQKAKEISEGRRKDIYD